MYFSYFIAFINYVYCEESAVQAVFTVEGLNTF